MLKQVTPDKPNFDLGLSEREVAQYSVGRAIVAALDPQKNKGTLEFEVSRAISEILGRPPRGMGLFVPTALRPQASGLDTKTGSAGNYLVEVQVPDLIDALRSQMRLVQLGAQLVPGLRFAIQFPVESSTTAASWVGENSATDVSQTDPTFAYCSASPHTLQATTSYSKQLLQQTAGNIGLEAWLRRDLTKSHAQAFDEAAIRGTGVEEELVGLLNNSGVNVVEIATNGGVPTYSTVCDLEASVANSNAPDGIAWLSTPDIRKKLRQTFINGTGSEPVWDADSIFGRPATVSTAVPSTLSKGTSVGSLSAIIAGVFSELLLLEFGVIEILVDPYALKKRGMIEVTSFSLCDVALPRPSAYAVCLDAALS